MKNKTSLAVGGTDGPGRRVRHAHSLSRVNEAQQRRARRADGSYPSAGHPDDGEAPKKVRRPAGCGYFLLGVSHHSQAHNISDYVPDVSKISGSQSTFDSRAVDALNALLKAARTPAGIRISTAPTART